ncbi:SDR family oxidoreductase [Pseudomonas protegens]|jgi:nucleoside-diphosphate-sugar epimerase|uniref:SDR family oxidoreductase n=2 Tax=Pseudomonas protegens TaxID=380021 RepID=A0ABY2VCS5_9PSED|nr:putative UDP-glucose 4-epimerase WbpV [Pseudomonas protegens Pf-5]ASE22272.1 NAD-dependent dehydratase [Pseudomonas protegens]PNW00558.1 NAD-dependent dehydratase [Pseudomonas protegens]QEZ54046.1 SDR family oxidoreductase [Pseudomonas protegens]QEZ59751.1 SDR family oxidoreductase [Pseudomonas protegens]
MARILLTGASGFVGGAVHECLSKHSPHKLTVVVRKPIPALAATTSVTQVEQIDGLTDWSSILLDCNVVVHAAARVHVMHESSLDPLEAFRKVNVEGTLNLARQAAQRGVGRFVFISSIKVNGEGTPLNVPYTADDEPAPTDPYGISKMEAEKGLTLIASQTGMEVVIIRPVLVYGPGVKANFFNMMRWLYKGIPLPFGAIDNRRSLVALDNLVDLIVTCIDHPLAANQVFLVSDGEDLSTTELLKRMGGALGKPARLLAIPSGILSFSAALLAKKSISQRLCGSLQVDISKNRELLGWAPPLSVDKALDATAKYFIDSCA